MIEFDARVKMDMPTLPIKSISVGVFSTKKAAIGKDKSAGFKQLGDSGIKARRIARRSKTMTLKQLAISLDKHYQFISKAADNPNNKYMKEFTHGLGAYFDGEVGERRLTALAQAIVRNPILDRKFRGNSQRTIDKKGFNLPLVDTGTLFMAIESCLEKN